MPQGCRLAWYLPLPHFVAFIFHLPPLSITIAYTNSSQMVERVQVVTGCCCLYLLSSISVLSTVTYYSSECPFIQLQSYSTWGKYIIYMLIDDCKITAWAKFFPTCVLFCFCLILTLCALHITVTFNSKKIEWLLGQKKKSVGTGNKDGNGHQVMFSTTKLQGAAPLYQTVSL